MDVLSFIPCASLWVWLGLGGLCLDFVGAGLLAVSETETGEKKLRRLVFYPYARLRHGYDKERSAIEALDEEEELMPDRRGFDELVRVLNMGHVNGDDYRRFTIERNQKVVTNNSRSIEDLVFVHTEEEKRSVGQLSDFEVVSENFWGRVVDDVEAYTLLFAAGLLSAGFLLQAISYFFRSVL